jgi:hypothetical protein
MTPAWKRLGISLLVLLFVLSYVVFKLADYILWWLQYDRNNGDRATLDLLDTAPGVPVTIVFGATCAILLLVNLVPLAMARKT